MARQVRKSGNTVSSPSIIIDGNDGADVSTSIVADDAGSTDGLIIIDPASVGSGGSDNGSSTDTTGEPVKRRGPKLGSTRSTSKKGAALDINGVEAILFSAHTILAAISKTPEMALDQSEAKELAKGIANVSRHYDVSTTQKTMDIANLVMVAGMIYGSRIMAIRNRKKTERPARAANAPSPVAPQPEHGITIPGVGTMMENGMLVQ